MRLFALFLLLAGCQRAEPPPHDTPGARLEAAAVARGLVSDPQRSTPVGSWASDSDRLCMIPVARDYRIGVSVDYGEGQRCAAAGTAERRGERLRVRFGDCRFDARYDGDRIAFPAELPAACQRLCTGRATLTAVAVERLSDSASEAAGLRGPDNRVLCAG